VLLFCAGAIWFVAHRRAGAIDTAASLLSRLPGKDSVILSIDFAALRRAGLVDLLASSQTPEEPEYKQFVAKTDFDYKQDLDLALASFGPTGKYFLLRGRFHWGSLTSYAKSSSGGCNNTFCEMPGSTPERRISFFPLRPAIMALAVSRNPDAADSLQAPASDARPLEPSTDPIWISIPGSVLRQEQNLPTGTKIFAQSLAGADAVMLSLGPKDQDFQVHLTARCRTEQDAGSLHVELERATRLLVSMLERENNKPNPRDLSGTLVSGTFRRDGVRVYGQWPIAHELISDLLSGQTR
jgi:hypothetical protein